MHTHTHAHKHTPTHTHTHSLTYTNTHRHTHRHTHAHTHPPTYSSTQTHIQPHTHPHTHTCAHAHNTHTHTRTHTCRFDLPLTTIVMSETRHVCIYRHEWDKTQQTWVRQDMCAQRSKIYTHVLSHSCLHTCRFDLPVLQCQAVCCNVLQCVAVSHVLSHSCLHTCRFDLPLTMRFLTFAVTCKCMCDHVRHELFICETWHVHMWDMTHSYVWHDSFVCVIRLIHERRDMSYSSVRHDPFMCETWPINVECMGHSSVRHDPFMF